MAPKKTSQPGHTFHPQEDDSCSVTSLYPFLINSLHQYWSTLQLYTVLSLCLHLSFSVTFFHFKARVWNMTGKLHCSANLFLHFWKFFHFVLSTQKLYLLNGHCSVNWKHCQHDIFPELHLEQQLRQELAKLRQLLPLPLHLYATTVLIRVRRCVCNLIVIWQDKMII